MTHQVDDLVDVVHEGDVGLSVRPDEEAGGGGDVVPRVDLGGGVQEGGQGDPGAHRPDGEDGEAEGKVRGLERLGPGYSAVSETERLHYIISRILDQFGPFWVFRAFYGGPKVWTGRLPR